MLLSKLVILYIDFECLDDFDCTSPIHGTCVEGECICKFGYSHGDDIDNCAGKIFIVTSI